MTKNSIIIANNFEINFFDLSGEQIGFINSDICINTLFAVTSKSLTFLISYGTKDKNYLNIWNISNFEQISKKPSIEIEIFGDVADVIFIIFIILGFWKPRVFICFNKY